MSSLNTKFIPNLLSSLGWSKAGSAYGGAASIYQKGSEKILIPVDDTYSDYDYILKKGLQTLSRREDIKYEKIVEKITFWNFDILKCRATGKPTKAGTIPIPLWTNIQENFSKNIKSAVNGLDVKRNRDGAPPAQQARDAVWDSILIGQTEVGSYVTRAMVPVTEKVQPSHYLPIGEDALPNLSKMGDLSYGRQISTLFMAGANELDRSLQSGNISDPLSRFTSLRRVSVSLCKSILEAHDISRDIGIEYQVKKTEIEESWENEIPNSVLFDPKTFSALEQVYRDLKPRETQKDIVQQGFILGLESGDVIENIDVGTIKIMTNKGRKIRIQLDKPSYRQALKAYELGAPISVKLSTLDNSTKTITLDTVIDFKVYTK